MSWVTGMSSSPRRESPMDATVLPLLSAVPSPFYHSRVAATATRGDTLPSESRRVVSLSGRRPTVAVSGLAQSRQRPARRLRG